MIQNKDTLSCSHTYICLACMAKVCQHMICMHIDQGWHLQGASLGRPGVVKDDYKTVFVRNISFKASEAEITDFFTQAGKVEDVRRSTDDTGLSCCCFPLQLASFP